MAIAGGASETSADHYSVRGARPVTSDTPQVSPAVTLESESYHSTDLCETTPVLAGTGHC